MIFGTALNLTSFTHDLIRSLPGWTNGKYLST